MRTDHTEIVSVEQALAEMEDGWQTAEAYARRVGRQMGWMMAETTMTIHDMLPHTIAFKVFTGQFNPWMQRHLEGVFRAECFTHSVS